MNSAAWWSRVYNVAQLFFNNLSGNQVDTTSEEEEEKRIPEFERPLPDPTTRAARRRIAQEPIQHKAVLKVKKQRTKKPIRKGTPMDADSMQVALGVLFAMHNNAESVLLPSDTPPTFTSHKELSEFLLSRPVIRRIESIFPLAFYPLGPAQRIPSMISAAEFEPILDGIKWSFLTDNPGIDKVWQPIYRAHTLNGVRRVRIKFTTNALQVQWLIHFYGVLASALKTPPFVVEESYTEDPLPTEGNRLPPVHVEAVLEPELPLLPTFAASAPAVPAPVPTPNE